MVRGMNMAAAGELARLGRTTADVVDGLDPALRAEAEAEAAKVVQSKLGTLHFEDRDFPRRLLHCPDAPTLLYTLGQCDFNAPRSVAIVGTRHASSNGIAFTRKLIEHLAAKCAPVTVVSGLAYGIDITAHRTAMDLGLPTVAVLAHGLRMMYPADHRGDAQRIVRSGGALVTEYRADTRPHPSQFLARNRLIAGLADVTVVIESDYKGGSLTTARNAAEYNREVFAMPGYPTAVTSRGCNRLIADGKAWLLDSPERLVEAMNWDSAPAAAPGSKANPQLELFVELPPEQRTVVDYLRQNPDDTVNDMAAALNIPYNRLSATLFDMEMSDIVAPRPGGRYAVIAAV